jgi:hypothetical protein
MSLNESINIGARIKAVQGTSNLAISQSTATAATTQDGLTIDRTLLGRRYYSCKAIAAFGYLPAATGTQATLGINFQHSSDGTSWDNFSTGTVPTAITFGNTTVATTDYKTVEQSVNLTGARRYVRMQVPPPTYGTSSSGQGVFSGAGVIVFGGADELVAQ